MTLTGDFRDLKRQVTFEDKDLKFLFHRKENQNPSSSMLPFTQMLWMPAVCWALGWVREVPWGSTRAHPALTETGWCLVEMGVRETRGRAEWGLGEHVAREVPSLMRPGSAFLKKPHLSWDQKEEVEGAWAESVPSRGNRVCETWGAGEEAERTQVFWERKASSGS